MFFSKLAVIVAIGPWNLMTHSLYEGETQRFKMKHNNEMVLRICITVRRRKGKLESSHDDGKACTGTLTPQQEPP